MTDKLISFKLAKLAKEKGFSVDNNEDFSFFNETRFPKFPRKFEYLRVGYNNDILAPTQTLLQRFLREEHNIIVQISAEAYKDGINWLFQVLIYDGTHWANNSSGLYGDNGEYNTHEEALEAGLIKGLTLIKL